MTRFKWVCDGCGKPVADNDGYVEADFLGALERERKADEQQLARATEGGGSRTAGDLLGDLADRGARIPWQVWHRRCDPEPDTDTYWIGVERFRDLEDLLEWNAHLSEKTWIQHTDWFRFIQRRLAPNAVQRKTPPPPPKGTS